MALQTVDFLKTLLGTPGPSGFEQAAGRVWRDEVKAFADDVRTRSFPDAEHSFWPKKAPVRAAPDPVPDPDEVAELDELEPEPPRRTGGYGPH